MKKHKKLACTALMLLFPVLLSGCSQSRQIENQAYILVMGLDLSDGGDLEISTLSPKISGSNQESASTGSQGGQSNYLQISVKAENYESALELLNWAVPRNLNLSQLKMIVLSRDLIESMDVKKLLGEIARTEGLFTAAQVVVCEGKAKDFVNTMQPIVGTRLSTSIDATLDHYVSYGLVPDSTLAILFYLLESVYSDTLATYAILTEPPAQTQEGASAAPASAMSGSIEKISGDIESDIKTRYLGAVVFSGSEFRGVLNGDQTILTNLLNNSLDVFHYTCDGVGLEFTPIGKTKVTVDVNAQPIKIKVDIGLSVSSQDQNMEEEQLQRIFQRDISQLIKTLQQMGAEPFGFAESAAKHFSTLSAWQEYNWKEKFKDAEVEIKLDFQHLNS